MTEQRINHPFAAEAADITTRPERLKELSKEQELRPIVAANPSTPAETLEILSEDRDMGVRRAVAQNPNTPVATLQELAKEFPENFLENPVMPLLQLAQPDFLRNSPLEFWQQILRSERAPLAWLRALRGKILAPRLYRTQQEQLDASVETHVAIAGEAPDKWEKQADEALAHYRKRAKHSTGDFQIRSLFSLAYPKLHHRWDKESEQASSQQGHTVMATTTAVTNAQRESYDTVRGKLIIAHDRHATVSQLEMLVTDTETVVRAAVATHQGLGYELPWQLVHDQEVEVRVALARNLHVPQDVLATLAYDADEKVRMAVAHNPRLPGQNFPVLLHDRSLRVRSCLANNAQLPQELIERLIGDPSVEIRKQLAANPRTTPEQQERLLESLEMQVWEGIARNPHTTGKILARLARDGDVDVQVAVVRNKRTPVTVIHTLAGQLGRVAWAELIANPHTPVKILQTILRESNFYFWQRIAQHPEVRRDKRRIVVHFFLERLQKLVMTNESLQFRLSLLDHTDLPEMILRFFARSGQWEERYLVARHSKTSSSVLKVLTSDGNRYVRAAARAALAKKLAKKGY